jgi:hypothetical protein
LNHETQALLVSYGEKNKMQNIYDSNSLISNSNIFMRRALEMLWGFYYMSQGSKTINLASQRENACLSMRWGAWIEDLLMRVIPKGANPTITH